MTITMIISTTILRNITEKLEKIYQESIKILLKKY